jgi:hypothetical protein
MQISHIGFVVKEPEGIVDAFSCLGFDHWETFQFAPPKETLIMGEPEAFNLKMYWTRMSGDLVLEIIKPMDKDSLWSKFLVNKGAGLHHIAFKLSNFDEHVSRLKKLGGIVLVGGYLPDFNDKRWVYMETNRDGFVIELIEDEIHDLAFPKENITEKL